MNESKLYKVYGYAARAWMAGRGDTGAPTFEGVGTGQVTCTWSYQGVVLTGHGRDQSQAVGHILSQVGVLMRVVELTDKRLLRGRRAMFAFPEANHDR